MLSQLDKASPSVKDPRGEVRTWEERNGVVRPGQ